MPHRTFADAAAGMGAASTLWWTQYLEPVLQGVVLITTAVFMILGVAIRWKTLRKGEADEKGED